AGAQSGQAFVGNIGYIGDRLGINPATGAVDHIVSLRVTEAQQPDPAELEAQQVRVVASLRAVVDLNGPVSGAAYFRGFHGTSVLYTMNRQQPSGITDCACTVFVEHQHPFDADGNAYGTDVRGLAVTPEGDLWIGDKKVLYFMPMLSSGPDAWLTGQPMGLPGHLDGRVLDVFPGVLDYIWAIGLDSK